jgi:hypothetical protein
MKGVADRDQMMQDMLGAAQAPKPDQQDQPTDPKSLIDEAIQRVSDYAENPEDVTPDTVQELLALLQQASDALGGGDESALPVGQGSEQVS